LLNIDIIMATYNGEKYIENQILSLMQQTYKNWTLYIHDDGSTDHTLEIVEKYIAIDSRIKLIDDQVKGLKAGKNFLHTLKSSSADYAIFCDQDDIWLESKLEKLYKAILEIDSVDQPVLVYCDGYSWSENGNINPESISTAHAKDLEDFIFFNGGYQGCSIMMNRKLVEMINSYNGYVYHHDDLVSLMAHTFGRVKFIPEQLMLYRQHSQAVTGNKDFKKNKFGRLFNNVGFVISKEHYKAKLGFYNYYKDVLNEHNDNVFRMYFSYSNKNNKLMRFIYILFSPLTFGGNKVKLLAKTLLQRLFNK
jgi:glycosyltransferase involved in cell wall biosynthesis